MKVLASNFIKGIQIVNEQRPNLPHSINRSEWKPRHDYESRAKYQANDWYPTSQHRRQNDGPSSHRRRQNDGHGNEKLAADLAGAILNILGNN